MMSTKSEGSYLPILVVICAPVLGPAGDKPLSHQPIDGWREWRRACEAVTNAKDPRTNRGAPLRLVRLHPPTLTNLREKCHAGRTHPAYPMVHLIGYVPGDRLLRMEQENGREEVVTPEDLASAFRDAGVQIVLLNICSGFEFASALVEQAGVQTVVTTHCAISDPEAILLVQKIYPRLAFGDSIGDALDFAKASIVEAYRQGDLPPLDNVDRDRRNLEQYGQQRAANIVLCGDANVRLQLPPSSEAAAEPEFDLSEPPNNLSHFDDIFIGRGVELVRISDWMDEHHFRTIALTGIGGIGKSSLAIATARRNCWRFHGVIYLTAKNTAGHYQSLSPDDVCRQVEVVLELDSPSSPPSQKDRYKRVKEVLNAHPYLLILDNLEVLTEKQSTELAGFLQLLDPRSGTVVLLTLRPEHFRPLVDKMKSEFYPLSVESLDSLDAVVLLYELLKLPVEREPTTDEWDVWEKVPSRPVMPRDQARLEWLADRADVPDDKVAALEELAEAAHRHPLLLRFATANLKEPAYDWDGVLRRLRGLKGDDLKEKVEDMIGKMCDDLARRKPGALTLLQALLVFSGGATSDALRFVWCGREVDDDNDEAEAFDDACRAARHASLLDFNAGRYDLHSLVRQYLETPDAQRNSSHPVSRQELLRRHVESFLSFAVSHIENFTALDRERANIFRAWEGCFTNDPSQAILFGLAMRHYLLMRGDYTFPRNNLGHQVGRDSNLDTKSVGFGNPTYRQKFCGKVYQEGTRLLSWSLQVTKELSDVRAQLVFLIELSKLLTDKGEYKQAACYC